MRKNIFWDCLCYTNFVCNICFSGFLGSNPRSIQNGRLLASIKELMAGPYVVRCNTCVLLQLFIYRYPNFLFVILSSFDILVTICLFRNAVWRLFSSLDTSMWNEDSKFIQDHITIHHSFQCISVVHLIYVGYICCILPFVSPTFQIFFFREKRSDLLPRVLDVLSDLRFLCIKSLWSLPHQRTKL